MVETNWTKLAAPHAVIETSLRNSSQERNFLLQRPGGETGAFGSIAGAETALTREFGRHVFEIAALLRVSQRLYNYRVWVVGMIGIELVIRLPVRAENLRPKRFRTMSLKLPTTNYF